MPETSREANLDTCARVIVAGYYANGDGYPNGVVTQQILAHESRLIDAGVAMPAGEHLWRAAKGSFAKRASTAWRFFWNNVASFFRVMTEVDRARDLVYVRYPALPFMLLMAIVPARFRPRCYADGFISIWETMFRDRASRSASGGRAVHFLEGCALRAAHRVLVDTLANAAFMQHEFALDPAKIIALPLGVDEARWRQHPAAKTRDGTFVVAFVGTFVPLHGFGVIASAIDLFEAADRIQFVFVGDGQQAEVLERLVNRRKDLDIVWHRGWHSPESIARIVAGADACLGVFGGEGKAARVLPYKLYLYLLLGRPVITQSAMSAPVHATPPVLGTQPSAIDLAAAIRRLRDDPALQAQLSTDGPAYYARYLSNDALAKAWRELLPAQGRANPSTLTDG